MPRTSLCVLIFLCQLISSLADDPLIDLPNLGKIRGQHDKSFSGRTIYSFEGVPYAKPPVGKYRFRESAPIKPWKGIWEAKTVYKCMQYNQYIPPGQDYVIGDEDCLYLNIYSPDLDPTANLNVIVYIHGGSFMFNYGGINRPDYLLDEDVVLVTINYRLGPLGFLSTEDDIVSGNNGMKDQILALKFVQSYIKFFGGNPNSVTIVGNSAGGASVHFHYLSPKSRHLFHRGFSQSGTTLVPWAQMEKPLEKTKAIASNLGCTTTNSEEMIKCLKKRPARQIVSSVKLFQPWLYIPFSPFGLVVDSWSSDPVLPHHPYKILENKQVYNVPWIVSYTNSEGLYPAEEFYENHLEEVDTRWNELIPLILDYNYTVDPLLRDEVSQKIRQHYLGDKKLSKSTFKDLLVILSDRIFVNDVQKTAKLQAAATTSPVYSYQFAYRGKHSWFEYEAEDGGNFGAAHADDVPYIFKNKAVDTASTETDREMIKFFRKMLVSFAETGKPEVSVEWPALSKNLKDAFTFLKIAGPRELSVESENAKNDKFWESLPIKENEKLFTAKRDEL